MKFESVTLSTVHSIDGIYHVIDQTGNVTYRLRTLTKGCMLEWSKHRTLSAAEKARDTLVAECCERYK